MNIVPDAGAIQVSAPSKAGIVVVGASFGALRALSIILPALKKGFALPVVIVVHIPPNRDSAIVDVFAKKCPLRIKEAEDKEPVTGGTVYFAPPNYHVLIEKNGLLSLSSDDLVNYSRPSIDVLFESAADSFGNSAVGVILSGANNDGAHGLAAIINADGHALIQEPETTDSPIMPEAAIAACPAASRMNLLEIAEWLNSCGNLKQ